MTATTITLTNYLEELRQAIPYVHPAGKATIEDWLRDMEVCTIENDTTTFAKLAQRITAKVQQELDWQAEDIIRAG